MKKMLVAAATMAVLCMGCADTTSNEEKLVPCGENFCSFKETCCEGVCVNTRTDPENCGTCGHSCGDGTCQNSVCLCGTSDSAVNCDESGKVCCSGVCWDIKNSDNHCGYCGHRCPTSDNASLHYSVSSNAESLCSNGICQISCHEGYSNLDQDENNGCECGNGEIEGDEVCDGNNLNGKTCASIMSGNSTGVLKCDSQCRFDTSGCMGGTVPVVTGCIEGTFQCSGELLQKCVSNTWQVFENCGGGMTCDAGVGQCSCAAGGCTIGTGFEWLQPLDDVRRYQSYQVGGITLNVSGTVIEDASGTNKSISFGENFPNDGQIEVPKEGGGLMGLEMVSFDVHLLASQAEISLIYYLSGETLQRDLTETVLRDRKVSFAPDRPDIIGFIIKSKGSVVIDNLSIAPYNSF